MSLSDASIAIDILSDEFIGRVFLRRREGGAYVNGRWVEGTAPQDQPICGVVYHMKGEELRDVPEELRREDMRHLWSRTPLRVQTRDEQEDQIVFDGTVFDVLKVWERTEGDYYKVMIGRNHVRTNTIR